MSEPRFIKRKGRLVLVTGCCPLPHGQVEKGRLRMRSPHGKRDAHPVEFTPEKLRELADELEREARQAVYDRLTAAVERLDCVSVEEIMKRAMERDPSILSIEHSR